MSIRIMYLILHSKEEETSRWILVLLKKMQAVRISTMEK